MVEKAHTATKTQSSQKKKFFLKVNENPTPPLKKKKKKTWGCVPLNATLLGFGSSKSSNLSDFVSSSIKWGHLMYFL